MVLLVGNYLNAVSGGNSFSGVSIFVLALRILQKLTCSWLSSLPIWNCWSVRARVHKPHLMCSWLDWLAIALKHSVKESWSSLGFLHAVVCSCVCSHQIIISTTLLWMTHDKNWSSRLGTIKSFLLAFFICVVCVGLQGSYAANARGFELESLNKLDDTRTNKPRMTLMHYLAEVRATKACLCCCFRWCSAWAAFFLSLYQLRQLCHQSKPFAIFQPYKKETFGGALPRKKMGFRIANVHLY